MIKTLTLNDRPWAAGAKNKYRCFLGSYQRYDCGIFLDPFIRRDDAQSIVTAFLNVPQQLSGLAKEHELTVSISGSQWTLSNNSSTIYADWFHAVKRFVSPHVEFGRRSMQGLLLPHFTHELCHLYWRTHLTRASRQAYTESLRKSMSALDVDVTEYCHSLFVDYMRYVSTVDLTRTEVQRKLVALQYLESWVEESFCETVACLRVPSYPPGKWRSTVSLATRREQIAKHTGLNVNSLEILSA